MNALFAERQTGHFFDISLLVVARRSPRNVPGFETMKKYRIDDTCRSFERGGIPTLADVARFAGVSVMSVWRTMNGESAVSERTRRKVVAAIEALHYAPNDQARILAGSRTVRICIVHNQDSRFLSEFLLNLLDQSVVNNVNLVVTKDIRVDGMIFLPSPYTEDMVTSAFRELDIPSVVVGSALTDEHVSAFYGDDREAAYKMTSHLIRLGHHRIGFISGPRDNIVGIRRLEGYRRAISENGADVSDHLVVSGDFTYRSGLDAAQRLLDLSERPTAIFASSDNMAAAAVALAFRRGLNVPSDLTVTGFGNTTIATSNWPELTTLAYPIADMAGLAIHALLRHVRAVREGRAPGVERSSMSLDIVRRQSDAAPRLRGGRTC
ncbi:LacI family DNA-binding transcriptional regulator [Massilia orientalis]|uniref:LacI family DNA-binding transcriptional regulator n=1 Tax=Massilia orientalis TaxID=3050128 RepID=A0ACC7MF36_9BURK|nr:LacI family DNA-binding transcriptional regulator [Massilia sp. YIM B02787]